MAELILAQKASFAIRDSCSYAKHGPLIALHSPLGGRRKTGDALHLSQPLLGQSRANPFTSTLLV